MLDYRAARAAIEASKQGSKTIDIMQANPGLVTMLLEMHRAQGTDTTREGLMATMKENKPEAE